MSGDIIPDQDNVHSLGTTSNRFQLNGGTPVTVGGSGTADTMTRFSAATEVENSTITNTDTLTTVRHTNDGNKIFVVSGSNGELLSVSDEVSDELLRVNDTSGIGVFIVSSSGTLNAERLTARTEDFVLTYNSASGDIFFQSSSIIQGAADWNTMINIPSGIVSGSDQVASTFAQTILDDTSAAAVRTTIGVDAAGTDNSTDVTLAGTPDYITISGQVITRNQIDLANDVTGTLAVSNIPTITAAKISDVEAGATADQTDAEIETAYNNQVSQVSSSERTAGTATGIRRFAPADIKSMIDTHETNTTYTVGDGGLTQKNFTTTLKNKLDGIEASADVTDATNVKASLPSGVISGSASQARTQLGVDPAGTDNSTDVTLGSTVTDVLSLSGQAISGVDAGNNRVVGWDDSESKISYLSAADARSALGLGTGATLNTAAIADGGTGLATADQIHTFVTAEINNLIDSAPGTLNTLNELAAAIGDDSNFSASLAASHTAQQTSINALNSATSSYAASSHTHAASDITSGTFDLARIPTLSAAKISDVAPFSQTGTYSGLRAQATTAGDVGLGNVTNESKSTMFSSAALTGTPTAPTADVGDDSTQIATTAYVKSQGYLTSADGGNATTLDNIDSSGFIRANADDDVSAHTEWQDSKEVRLGTSADFKMYHNGTNTFQINETGNLIIRQSTNDGNIVLQSDDGSGGHANYVVVNGSNENVQLLKPVEVTGHITPSVTETYDLGSDSLRFRDLHLSGATIYLGGKELNRDEYTFLSQSIKVVNSNTGSYENTEANIKAALPAGVISGSAANARAQMGIDNASNIPNLNASKITAGTLGADRIPNLNASKINAGTLGADRIPNLNASKITAGTLGDARIPSLAASKVTSGTFDAARIPTLTAAKISDFDTEVSNNTTVAANTAKAGYTDAKVKTKLNTEEVVSGSAAEVRTFLNVADGATANAGTVTSVGGTGTVSGLSLSGTVTSTGNLTLGGTISLVAGDIPNLNASKITAGTLGDARIPSLNASKITAGTFGVARIPTLTAAKISDFDTEVSNNTSVAANTAKTGYTDAAVKSKLNTDTVVSGSASQVRSYLGLGGAATLGTAAVADGGTSLATGDQIHTFVTAQINNLIDSAPGTLNTLNELAAAIGDDSNFSASLAASHTNQQTSINALNTFTGSLSSSDISDVDAFSQSGTYSSLRAQGTTKGDVGLGNVANTTITVTGTSVSDGTNTFNKATLSSLGTEAFDSDGTYTSLRAQGTTKADVGLGNVANTTITVTGTSVSDGTNTFNKFDGAYSSLTGTPTIPSGNQIIDWTVSQTENIHADNYTNTTYSVGDGGLTQKNFTTTLKNKLDGIAASANNYSHPNHTGDVTSAGDGATTIGANKVTHAKYQQVATDTIIGRTAAGTGNVTALTAAEVRGIINVANGATNTEAPAITSDGASPALASGISAAEVRSLIGATANTGTVDTSGTPVDNDFAKFTDANTIEGRSYSEVKSDLGLNNVTNESKATMFASPTFTGTVSGVTKSHVGLGNVTNESKATMFSSAALTGTPTAPTAATSTNTTQIATTAFVKAQGYITSADGGNAATLDNLDSTDFYREVDSATATAGGTNQWVTVAHSTGARTHGEVIVTDNDSGDHAFIRIDWMRSYADSIFTVINCGGHANRITGVRVLEESADVTYGSKYLQILTQASSGYKVKVNATADVVGYGNHEAVAPVNESSKTGYAVDGNTLDNLDTYGFAAQEGIHSGGDIEVGGRLKLSTTDNNTSSTTALVLNGTEVEKRTLGSNAFNSTSFLTAHPSISAASSVNNSGRTYIQDITLDSNGHVTGITSATETVTNTDTQLSNEQVQDIVGAMVSGNTETNISVTYDDTNGKLNFSSTDTNTTYSAGTGVTLSGTTFSIGQSVATNATVQFGLVRSTGDVVAYYSSDERLKDNFKPLTGALEKVNKLGGYEFDWNDKQDTYEAGTHSIGVKAQEVQEQYPDLVVERENGYLAVDYVKMNAVLIEAVKELSAKVEALEAKLK